MKVKVAELDLEGNGTITGLKAPIAATDAATKGYVDSVANGGSGGSGGGKKYATIVIGNTVNHTADEVDYLCDGVDDHVEFNAAIDSLGTDGGEIVILEGEYTVGDDWGRMQNRAYSYTKIRGVGKVEIKGGWGFYSQTFENESALVELENLYIEGEVRIKNSPHSTITNIIADQGVSIIDSSHCKIMNVIGMQAGTGLHINYSPNCTVTNMMLLEGAGVLNSPHSTLTNVTTEGGVYLSSSPHSTLTNVTAVGSVYLNNNSPDCTLTNVTAGTNVHIYYSPHSTLTNVTAGTYVHIYDSPHSTLTNVAAGTHVGIDESPNCHLTNITAKHSLNIENSSHTILDGLHLSGEFLEEMGLLLGLAVSNSEGVKITNVFIDGSENQGVTVGMVLTGVKDVSVDNVQVENCAIGISVVMSLTDYSLSQKVIIRDCIIKDPATIGIVVGMETEMQMMGGDYIHLDGNIIDGGQGYGILLDKSSHSIIRGNTCINNGGIYGQGDGNLITGNQASVTVSGNDNLIEHNIA